jgi:hypothetical protein
VPLPLRPAGLASCNGEPIVRNQGYLLEAMYWDEAVGVGGGLRGVPGGGCQNKYISSHHCNSDFNEGVNPNRFSLTLETALVVEEGDPGRTGQGRIVVCWQGKERWTEADRDQLYFSASSPQMAMARVEVPTPKHLRAYHRALGVTFEGEEAGGDGWYGDGGGHDSPAQLFDGTAGWEPVPAGGWEGSEPTPKRKAVVMPALEWVSLRQLTRGQLAAKACAKNAQRFQQLGFQQAKKDNAHIRIVADYYQAQLDLFAEMCCGRSHYCSRSIGKQFPYELLMVGVRDKQLPDIFRASFARLMQNLYVDVFPHEVVSLPSLVRNAVSVQPIEVRVADSVFSKPADLGGAAVAREGGGRRRNRCRSAFCRSRRRKLGKIGAGDDEAPGQAKGAAGTGAFTGSSGGKYEQEPFDLRLWLVDSSQGRGVLDGGVVLVLIMTLVLASLGSAVAGMVSDFTDTHDWGQGNIYAFYFDTAVMGAFVVEASLRMYAMGTTNYLSDGLCLTDAFVIVADVVALVVQLTWTTSHGALSAAFCCGWLLPQH